MSDAVGHTNPLVTTMSHSQQQPVVQGCLQQQHPQLQQQQSQMQQQQQLQQMQLPAKQLWVQTGASQTAVPVGLQQLLQQQVTPTAAAAANGANHAVMAAAATHQSVAQHAGGFQQQQQQQQPAWSGHQAPVAAAPHLQPQASQQPTWQVSLQQHLHMQQQQQPVTPVGVSAHHITNALTMGTLQQQQQQQPQQQVHIATQLLVPGLGQLPFQQQLQQPQTQPEQQSQQLQQQQQQLSPVIALHNSQLCNSTATTLYRRSPRLSADGCLSNFLLPRISADGGFGGLGSSQWTAATAAAAPAATGGIKPQLHQQGQVSLQQQQQQQQQHVMQQQQRYGSMPTFQGFTKASNNSGSSSSGEWVPAADSTAQGSVAAQAGAYQQQGSLSGLVQGFAAGMQARTGLQPGPTQAGGNTSSIGLDSSTQLRYQAYEPCAVPLPRPWLASTAASAAAAAAGSSSPTAAAAAADQSPAEALPSLPDFAHKIAADFKAALETLRSSMARSSSAASQADGSGEQAQQQPQPALGRHGSSSGSNSPVNSSPSKAPLPGSCQSIVDAHQQQQQQLPPSPAQQQQQEQLVKQEPDTAAAAAHPAAGDSLGDSKGPPTLHAAAADVRPAGLKRPAAAIDAPAADDLAPPDLLLSKRQKQCPAGVPSVPAGQLLPPLSSSTRGATGSPAKPAGSTSTAGTAACSPPRPPAAAAGAPLSGSASSLERSTSGLKSCSSGAVARSVWSDTPPPPEAPAALLELAAQMQQAEGAIQLPATAEAAAGQDGGVDVSGVAGPGLTAPFAGLGLLQEVQQQQQQPPGSVAATATAALAAAAQQLLTLPAEGAEDPSGTQKHRALVAGLMKKATDDARACGLADPSLLVVQLMSILDDHVAALSQLGSPGTDLGVVSAGGLTVELPNVLTVGGAPADANPAADQGVLSAAIGLAAGSNAG